jgi:hypothetical protein
MAATAARVQRAEEPPPPPRSPERQRLAVAVAQHQAAVGRLETLRAAENKALDQAIDAHRVLDEAEAALAEARKREPRRRVAELLGEDAGDEPFGRAEQRLEGARVRAGR